MLLSERHRKSPKCPLKTIGLFDTADAAVDRQVVTRNFDGTTDRTRRGGTSVWSEVDLRGAGAPTQTLMRWP